MGYTITPAPAPTYGLSTTRPLSATPGAFYFETDTKKTYQYDGGWKFVHVIPDQNWIAPVLASPWSAYGSGYDVPGYRRHSTGQIEIRGLVKATAAATTIFTLPTGYRPLAGNLIFDTMSNTTVNSRLDINTTGAVIFSSGDIGYVSINCSFFAEG